MKAAIDARPKLLVLNQYYDSVEATGQLLRQLCEDLSEDFEVTVIAARPPGGRPGDGQSRIRILWAPSTRLPKSALSLRFLNYLTFLCAVLVSLTRAGRPAVVLCMTDPPVIGLVGAGFARLVGARMLLVYQDIHPEVGVISGTLTNPLVVGLLRVIQRLLLGSADHVVAIGHTMRDRLITRGADREHTTVVSNWVDLDLVGPEPRDNDWARAHSLNDGFVVMHSGNVGQLQGLDTLLDVAAAMPDVRFAIVGEGSSKNQLVQRASREHLANVAFLPHQPATQLRYSLASADVHLVSLADGLGGYLEPSKVYGVLAAGRPVLAAVDPDSEAARLIGESGCGLVVPPGEVSAWCAGIRHLRGMAPVERESLGAAGHLLAERCHSRAVATAHYARLISSLAGDTR